MLNYDDISIVPAQDVNINAISDSVCVDILKKRVCEICDELKDGSGIPLKSHPVLDGITNLDMWSDNGSLMIQTKHELRWSLLFQTRNIALTHIITRVISEYLELIQCAFPDGFYSNVIYHDKNLPGYPQCRYDIMQKSDNMYVNPADYKRHAAALHWMNGHYKELGTCKSIYINIIPTIHCPEESIGNIHAFLTELCHYPDNANIGINKMIFESLCAHYMEKCNMTNGDRILNSISSNYTYTIPVQEALYYINKII